MWYHCRLGSGLLESWIHSFQPQTCHDGCVPSVLYVPQYSTVPPVFVHVPWSVERWVRCSESLKGLHNSCIYTRWRHFKSPHLLRRLKPLVFAKDRDVKVYQWTRWSWRLKPGATQEIHMTVLVVCDKQSTAVTFESNLFGWSQQKKKKNSFSSLPKFCITVKEKLFLRALHSSQYVNKKMRGWITVCIWSLRLMGL